MPPLITIVVAGVTAYAGYRYLSRKGAKIARGLKRARADMEKRAAGEPGVKNLGTLKRDPDTGDYKPDGGDAGPDRG